MKKNIILIIIFLSLIMLNSVFIYNKNNSKKFSNTRKKIVLVSKGINDVVEIKNLKKQQLQDKRAMRQLENQKILKAQNETQKNVNKNDQKTTQNNNTKQNVQIKNAGQTNSSSTTKANGLKPIPSNHTYEYLQEVENEVLVLCNVERQKAGVSPLRANGNLITIARYKANEMLQYHYFSHQSPYTGYIYDLMTDIGYEYTCAGENIQDSQGADKSMVTAKMLVDNWMASPGHKANILRADFHQMGIGVVFTSDGNLAYESQVFSN